MAHEPPLVRTAEINALCMEIAELVGALGSASALSTSPVLHREKKSGFAAKIKDLFS